MKANIIFKDRHSKVTPKDMLRLTSFHYHNPQDSISQEDFEALTKKKPENRCLLCYKNDEERLKLFLLQDDRVYESDNPMTVTHLHKAPIPDCFRKRKKIIKPYKKETPILREKNVIDINNQVIDNLNYEMEKYEGKIQNEPNKNDLLLFGKTYSFFKNNQIKEEKKLLKIFEINPMILDKKQQNIKSIPYILKNNRPWSGILNSKGHKVNASKKVKDDSFMINFSKKRINIEDVLATHNSNIRKGFSQYKVNNSKFRQNLKLKNRHLFTPDLKTNNFNSPFETKNIIYMKVF